MRPGWHSRYESVLDTGADDTVVPEWIAAAIGLNLTGVEERPIGLAGRAPLRGRYALVEIQISDGTRECLPRYALLAEKKARL